MRLTKKLKKEISDAVQRGVFKSKMERFIEDEHVAGDAVYDAWFTPKQKAAMDSLPADWFELRNSLQIHRGNGSCFDVPDLSLPVALERELGVHERFWSRTGYLEMSRQRPMPESLRIHSVDLDGAEQTVLALEKRAKAIRSASGKLQAELDTLLNACTTVAKLRASWPDVDRFLPDEVLNPVKNLPVPVAKVEQALRAAEAVE